MGAVEITLIVFIGAMLLIAAGSLVRLLRLSRRGFRQAGAELFDRSTSGRYSTGKSK